MAVCLAGSLLSRNDQFASPDAVFLFRYGARLCKVLTYVVVALICWRRPVRVRPLLYAAGIFGVLSFVIGYVVEPLFAGLESMVFAAGALSGAFNGIAGALVTLLFLVLLSSYSFRWATSGIFLGMAASHVLFLASTSCPAEMLYWSKPVSLLVAIGMLAGCCALAWRLGILGDSVLPDEAKQGGAPSGAGDWNFVLALVGLAVFPFLYVFIAELNAGWGVNGGMFSLAAESSGIVMLLLAAAVMPALRSHMSIEGAFVAVQILFSSGALLLPLVRDDGLFLSGVLLKCGFLLYNGLVWAYLAVRPWTGARTALIRFGLATGVLELFSLVGRFAGEALRSVPHVDMSSTANAAIVAVWVLAMGTMVFVLVTRLKGRREWAAIVDVAASQPDVFDEECRALAESRNLTKREAEVMTWYARGRSVDHIAEELAIAPGTVKTHLKRVYVKADVHNRQELLDALAAALDDSTVS